MLADGGRAAGAVGGQSARLAHAEADPATLHQITATLADALAEHDITVTCVNPGPTDTGWASPEQDSFVARHMPRGRWNTPAEAAEVVALLLSPQATTITGQVIDAEGGFRRCTP